MKSEPVGASDAVSKTSTGNKMEQLKSRFNEKLGKNKEKFSVGFEPGTLNIVVRAKSSKDLQLLKAIFPNMRFEDKEIKAAVVGKIVAQ